MEKLINKSRLAWCLWIIGTVLIALYWFSIVSITIGWIGFGIALTGSVTSWGLKPPPAREKLNRLAWYLWVIGAVLIVLCWFSIVSTTIGWIGFGIALIGGVMAGDLNPAPSSPPQEPSTQEKNICVVCSNSSYLRAPAKSRKDFVRRCRTFQAILLGILMLFCVFFATMPLSIGFQNGSKFDMLSSFIMLLLVIVLFSYAMFDTYRRITIDDSGITIKMFFIINSISWGEIVEFRAEDKGTGFGAGVRYYLITKRFEDTPIKIGDNNIKDLDELIDAIFMMATNAKFIRIENISVIPFLRKTKMTQWDRKNKVPLMR